MQSPRLLSSLQDLVCGFVFWSKSCKLNVAEAVCLACHCITLRNVLLTHASILLLLILPYVAASVTIALMTPAPTTAAASGPPAAAIACVTHVLARATLASGQLVPPVPPHSFHAAVVAMPAVRSVGCRLISLLELLLLVAVKRAAAAGVLPCSGQQAMSGRGQGTCLRVLLHWLVRYR